MTNKQISVMNQLNGLIHKRFNIDTLREKLRDIFGINNITIYSYEDECWTGDWYYSFGIDDDELGGYFVIYYLMMRPQLEEDDDGLRFYVTEVAIEFDYD